MADDLNEEAFRALNDTGKIEADDEKYHVPIATTRERRSH